MNKFQKLTGIQPVWNYFDMKHAEIMVIKNLRLLGLHGLLHSVGSKSNIR